MKQGEVWSFKTKRFEVSLILERDRGYQYDGNDEDGETQAKLDSGKYVAFNSCVQVTLDGERIADSWLCGSVYSAEDYSEFWTAHRDSDPLNRNCTIMRRAWRGGGDPDAKVSICHYFPGMVAEACKAARAHCDKFPKMRHAA